MANLYSGMPSSSTSRGEFHGIPSSGLSRLTTGSNTLTEASSSMSRGMDGKEFGGRERDAKDSRHHNAGKGLGVSSSDYNSSLLNSQNQGPSSSAGGAHSTAHLNNQYPPSVSPAPSTASSFAGPFSSSHGLGGGSSGNHRPLMGDRMPSTLSESANSNSGNTPVATNSALNKAASASSSLYQNCRIVLERLYRVPGFLERFFPEEFSQLSQQKGSETHGGEAESAPTPATPSSAVGSSSDPVSRSLHTLRLGSSLCYLFNALKLPKQLEVNPAATMSNLKACQRGTAHFIMACKQELGWSDLDLFAIHELYGQDTNGVVKVINTVTKMLDLLESKGILLAAAKKSALEEDEGNALNRPTDDRSMVVREILDSERKYVQDLEVLQDYQRQVQANDIVTQDQIHNLFLNLNSLADFQRRFLIGVEANASQPPEHQRFGHLFLQMEDHFSVYEPYCANLTAAQDLAIAENAALSKLSHVLDPVSELAPLLIKPVQRLCKYPLLVSTLVKNTPNTSAHYAELQEGLASIMRVTDKVNETKRREDNRQAVITLGRRVEDWKGHDINSFGELLLQETFFVIKSDSEREYNVYLFERIILCCKESGVSGKKSSKSNSILRKPPNKKATTLQLKGRIFVNNVTGASPANKNGQYLLEVRWRGDVAEEAFTIKCRTEELLKQWQRTIMRAVDESPNRRRANQVHTGRRSDPRLTGGSTGLMSPQSQFPATPLTDQAYASSPNLTHGHFKQQAYPTTHGGFDDEGDDAYETTESGRSPSSAFARRGPSMRSLPAMEKDDKSTLSNTKPRAQTEDQTSSVINQWRSQTPTNPNSVPIHRNVSHTSLDSQQSLKNSQSNQQLRPKPSSEWTSAGSSPAMGYSRLPIAHDGIDASANTPRHRNLNGPPAHYIQDDGATPRPPALARGISNVTSSIPHPVAPPLVRNRSASSPIMYAVPGQPNQAAQFPPVRGTEWSAQNGTNHQGSGSGASLPPLKVSSHKGSGTNSGGTLASASSTTSVKKRFSSSSTGTDRSSAASSTSSPSTNLAGSLPPSAGLPPLPYGATRAAYHSSPAVVATAIRIKVSYIEDNFVVVVLSSISYGELLEKILKKIRLCSSAKDATSLTLRIRYQDEDGDRILITSEEDVVMAFESARPMEGHSNTQSLTLFAAVD